MNERSVQTDINAMSTFINLSALPEPTKASWVQRVQHDQRSEGLPAPTDYYVVAILEYDSPQSALSDQFSGRGDVYVEDQLLETWMPQSISSRFVRTQEGYLMFDGKAYKADSVLQSPLTYGYILFIDNYVFIYGATV